VASPAFPLLLVVHGRSGGMIPPELQELAAELEGRRGAPVGVRALTQADPAEPPCGGGALRVVPLLLLPGGHVRRDLPVLMADLRRRCAVPPRRLPFLGAWPCWQRLLAAEAEALAKSTADRRLLLLHHPLEGALAGRYLALLGRRCRAECRPAPYSSLESEETGLAFNRPVLPLALAANRLTEHLEPSLGAAAAPLLQRPALRRQLLAALESLP